MVMWVGVGVEGVGVIEFDCELNHRNVFSTEQTVCNAAMLQCAIV